MDEQTIAITNKLRADLNNLNKLVEYHGTRFVKIILDIEQIQEDIIAIKNRILSTGEEK